MEKNDIVYIDYEVWIKEDSKLYDTTKEELAREHGIYEPSINYGPRAIILGKEQTFKVVEDSLMKAKVGEEYEVNIPPEDAFGKRDAKLVELLPISRIIRMGITPDVGKEVEINGKKGIVTFVTASRVRIDFNHPLAGKTLSYKYTVVKKAEKPEEKIRGIIDAYYGKGDEFEIKNGKTLELKLPDICKYDHRWHEMKYLIISDLREIVSPETIIFIEEYKGKRKEEPAKSEEEKKEIEKEEKEDKGEEKPAKQASKKSEKGSKKDKDGHTDKEDKQAKEKSSKKQKNKEEQ